jgi:flagellar biosynthesis protein FlhA
MPGFWLAMNATNSKINLKGVPTVEPVFGLPATWITEAERKTAEVGGFTLVDAASVLVTHLSETVKRIATPSSAGRTSSRSSTTSRRPIRPW